MDATCGGLILSVLSIILAFYYGIRANKYERALIKIENIQRKRLEVQDELYMLRYSAKNTQSAIKVKNEIIQEKELRIKDLENKIIFYERIQSTLLNQSGARFVPARFKEGPGPVGVWFLHHKWFMLNQKKEKVETSGVVFEKKDEKKIVQLNGEAWENFLDACIKQYYPNFSKNDDNQKNK